MCNIQALTLTQCQLNLPVYGVQHGPLTLLLLRCELGTDKTLTRGLLFNCEFNVGTSNWHRIYPTVSYIHPNRPLVCSEN